MRYSRRSDRSGDFGSKGELNLNAAKEVATSCCMGIFKNVSKKCSRYNIIKLNYNVIHKC